MAVCSAWHMWSSPVMLGGGKHIVNFGLGLVAFAVNSPASSQRAYQPGSMALASYAVCMSAMVLALLIGCVWSKAGDRRAGVSGRLARRRRLAYRYGYVAAHADPYVTACPAGACSARPCCGLHRTTARRT